MESKDGPVSLRPSILAGPFAAATRLVLAYPWAVVGGALALAAAAAALALLQLGYRTSRLDLLNPKSDYNRLWIEYIQEFGDDDDAVIVVEGPSREVIVPVLDELWVQLAREERLFRSVMHEVNLGKVRAKGLHYLPPDELLAIDGFLNEAAPVLRGDWSALKLSHTSAAILDKMQAAVGGSRAPPSPAATDGLDRYCDSLAASLGRGGEYRSCWPDMPSGLAALSDLNSNYLLTGRGKLGFVLLRLAKVEDSFSRNGEATDVLRRLIADVQSRHPKTTIGLTGLPIMESDEMRSSQSSMLWASLISFIGVGVVFVAGFGGLRHAALANLVLLVGMAWAFGFVTLSVGHLNILSVTFTVTLIGLGIDYGVYYVARYVQRRNEGLGCEEALVETSRSTAPAITTAALATSVAFFSASLTSFTGVAELGLIAGGGLLFCAAAQLFVLPAVIFLVDRRSVARRMPRPLAVHRWIAPAQRWPRAAFALTAGVTALAALGLGRVWYDNNLLNMQATGLESVELERKLLSEGSQSAWYALSICDTAEELLARKARFLKLPSVERTEEIVSLLPADHKVKQPIIRRIEERLASLPERPPLLGVDRPEVAGQALARIERVLAQAGVGEESRRKLALVRDRLRRMPAADCYAALSRYQQQMAGDLLSRLHLIHSIANPAPPSLADLPANLVERFVGHHGRHLLKIYGRGDMWDTASLASFVRDVRSVDSRATGNPLQAHEASMEMRRSFQEAAIYTTFVIACVLLADFRRLRDVALAALPLAAGMVQLFGLLGWLQIPLNPANLIALPLILGIGIDYGVHIVHEFREQSGPYRMSAGTAAAVLVDALTTIVGFGSLMVASHQGLHSLGRVLTIGVTCCLINSVVVLPALLAWMTRGRGVSTDQSQPVIAADQPPIASKAAA